MSLRKKIFAAIYDPMSRASEEAGMREMRHGLLAEAGGSVLEIGAGTGANLAHYDDKVESLVFTEPEPAMLRRLERKASEEAPLATILQAPAEDLPFEDDGFDTVVSTLVLCGVADQRQALREVRRVLRPGGRLLFIEHVRSDDPKLAKTQDRMNGVNKFLVGCECNRATVDTIKAEGFEVDSLEQTTLNKVPKFVRPAIVGAAATPA